jgi:hypothetical protein
MEWKGSSRAGRRSAEHAVGRLGVYRRVPRVTRGSGRFVLVGWLASFLPLPVRLVEGKLLEAFTYNVIIKIINISSYLFISYFFDNFYL